MSAITAPRKIGLCTRCYKTDREVQARHTHGERVLCDDCAAKPYVIAPVTARELRADREYDEQVKQRRNGRRKQHPEPLESAHAALSDLLWQDDILGARIVGRGMAASLDLYMVSGVVITFMSMTQFTAPTTLANTVTMATGKPCPILSMVDINKALVLVKQIAAHEVGGDEDDAAIGWGLTYLQTVGQRVLLVDVNDRRDRWGAFVKLTDSRDIVIEHLDGTRWVRTAWFFDHARVCDSAAGGNAQIATAMERVGWTRRGTRGRVKATDPAGLAVPIYHSFFDVPAGWEQAQTLGDEVTR